MVWRFYPPTYMCWWFPFAFGSVNGQMINLSKIHIKWSDVLVEFILSSHLRKAWVAWTCHFLQWLSLREIPSKSASECSSLIICIVQSLVFPAHCIIIIIIITMTIITHHYPFLITYRQNGQTIDIAYRKQKPPPQSSTHGNRSVWRAPRVARLGFSPSLPSMGLVYLPTFGWNLGMNWFTNIWFTFGWNL